MASRASVLCQAIHETSHEDLPVAVRHQLKRCFLDLAGAMLAGSVTPAGAIAAAFALEQWSGSTALIPVFGGCAHPTGAAFAGGVMANALDIDDGYRAAKGHPGAAVIPAALAVGCEGKASGPELLAAIAVGYEVGIRTGLLTHATYSDYHASGSWTAVGAAACASRLLGLNEETTLHALGVAEYHAPISPMVRCLEEPAMVKDGLGWGSMVGVSSAYLARAGFTGVTPLLAEEAGSGHLDTLGKEFLLQGVYFKPYACCRWAHPAIAAALELVREHALNPAEIETITVETFSLTTHLRTVCPRHTEDAQYSVSYPMAAALVWGKVGPAEVSEGKLTDPRVLRLAQRVHFVVAEDLDRVFPEQCLARVRVDTAQGGQFESDVYSSPWDTGDPPTDDELKGKFRDLAGLVLPEDRVRELEEMLWHAEEVPAAEDLVAATWRQ